MPRILIGNIRGPKGEKGDTGESGPRGATGATGPQGPLPPLANNGTTTQVGVAALDAVYGKTLTEKDVDLQRQITQQNSNIETLAGNLIWSNLVTLGTNCGITIKYRYNGYFVEYIYSGTLEAKALTGGSNGYVIGTMPKDLMPKTNSMIPFAASNTVNKDAYLMCFPGGTPNSWRLAATKNLTLVPEYICGTFLLGR